MYVNPNHISQLIWRSSFSYNEWKVDKIFIYLFSIFLIGTIATNCFNFRSVQQLIPEYFFHTHRWVWTIHNELIIFDEFSTKLLCSIFNPICGSYCASITLHGHCYICKFRILYVRMLEIKERYQFLADKKPLIVWILLKIRYYLANTIRSHMKCDRC